MSRESLLFILCTSLTLTSAGTVLTSSSDREHFSARSIGRSLAKCLGEPNTFVCLQKEIAHNLDMVLSDNSTWRYSDFLEFERDPSFIVRSVPPSKLSDDAMGEEITEKLMQLAEARSIRLKLNPRSLDAETKDYDHDEGRKKKDKDKGMAMFGGVAMIAMMAQMFLGKVLLIAGSAFVMAKIALVISLLTSLKTKSSGGGNTEHVVTYTDAGGGGGGGHSGGGYSGWHRSLPHGAHTSHVYHEPVEEDHHSSPQSSDYQHYDAADRAQNYNFI